MDRFIRYAAYLANAIMVIAAGFIAAGAYGHDVYLALLLMVPPSLSLLAIYFGPDMEERRLTRALNKARMQKELDSLVKKKPSGK